MGYAIVGSYVPELHSCLNLLEPACSCQKHEKGRSGELPVSAACKSTDLMSTDLMSTLSVPVQKRPSTQTRPGRLPLND
jgi:hypothetical protein